MFFLSASFSHNFVFFNLFLVLGCIENIILIELDSFLKNDMYFFKSFIESTFEGLCKVTKYNPGQLF